MSCTVCFEPFNRNAHFPMMGACGHSICRRCYRSIRNDPCPLCNDDGAFTHATRNYQMSDLKDEMDEEKREHENEKKELMDELEEEKKDKNDLREALQRAENEKKEAEKRMTDMRKQIEKESSGAEVILRCHICANQVEEKKARVCEPCNVENRCIIVETDGTIVVNDAERMNEHVMCAYCFMEGDHEGHKSHLLVPLKRCCSAKNAYSGLRTKLQDATNSIESNVLKLKKEFDLPLSRLEQIWPQVLSDEELKEIEEMCRLQTTAGEEIATNQINDLTKLQSDFSTWLLRQGQGFYKVLLGESLNDFIPLTVHTLYSVSDVKKIIENRRGLPASDQILTFQDRELEDGETMRSCGIKEEDELDVSTRIVSASENE